MPPDALDLLRDEPRLARLLQLARERFQPEEVWLFGSRARGTAQPDSDWDIMLILPDAAPDAHLHPTALWDLGRSADLIADVLAGRATDMRETRHVATTLSRTVAEEGIRLDV